VLSSSELWWSLLLVVQFTSFTYWFRHEVADIMSVSRQHADSSREPPVPAARVVLSPPLLPFLLCVLAQCVGPSMLPTMNLSGDVVLIRRLSASAYQRGDVVVATSVLNPRLMVCKRIIALPGDTITVHKPTPELPFPAASAFPYRPSSSAAVEFTLPAGHCWLQGDNTPNSSDSRLYGAVPMAILVGRVDYRLWPITQAGSISRTMAYSGQDRWSREEEQDRRRRSKDETVEGGRSIGRRMPVTGGMHVLAESDSTPQPAAAGDDEQQQSSHELRDGDTKVSVSILHFTPAKKRTETVDK
jgi:inner membrane protease subunit 1